MSAGFSLEAQPEQVQTGPAVLPSRIRRVVGIDLSLTATGIAVIDNGQIGTFLVKSKSDAGTLESFVHRSRDIAEAISRHVHVSDLVLIEGMSFGSKSKSLDKIHGHWWMTVERLLAGLVQEPVVVAPSARCKYATGKGNASKDEVLAAAVKRYPDADVINNNTADALVLAAMGARHLGGALEQTMPEKNLAALDAIQWDAVTA